MRPVGSYKSVCDVGEMCQDIAIFSVFPFFLALCATFMVARAHTHKQEVLLILTDTWISFFDLIVSLNWGGALFLWILAQPLFVLWLKAGFSSRLYIQACTCACWVVWVDEQRMCGVITNCNCGNSPKLLQGIEITVKAQNPFGRFPSVAAATASVLTSSSCVVRNFCRCWEFGPWSCCDFICRQSLSRCICITSYLFLEQNAVRVKGLTGSIFQQSKPSEDQWGRGVNLW